MAANDGAAHTGRKSRIGTALFILLLAGLLSCAACVRYAHITGIGLGRSYDNGSYLANALALGETTEISRFDPLLFAADRAAIGVLGYNDYSIKAFRAATDLITLALLIYLVARFTRNRWAGLAAGLLYAFASKIVFFARTEMAHTPAALLVLLAFLALARYLTLRGRRRRTPDRAIARWLGLSGALSAAGMAVHPSLCFTGPVFTACIVLARLFAGGGPREALRDAAVYTAAFLLALGTIALSFYSPEAWYAYLDHAAGAPHVESSHWAYLHDVRSAMSGPPLPVAEGLDFAINGLRWVAGGAYPEVAVMREGGLYTALFLGIIPLMLALRRHPAPAWAYAAYFSVFGFAIALGLFLRIYDIGISRYMLPWFPVAILAICAWYYRILRRFMPGRLAGALLAACSVAVVASENPIYPGHPALDDPYTIAKELHREIGGRVDENNRLLALPYGIGVFVYGPGSRSAIWLSHDLYFGGNAIWPRDVDISEVGTADVTISPEYIEYHDAESLRRACGERAVRFVFCSDHVNPNAYHNGDPPFDQDAERRFINQFLRDVNAERIYFSPSGVLYRIPEESPACAEQILR